MNNRIVYCASCLIGLLARGVWGYEGTTHEVLSKEAAIRSSLYTNAALLSDFGQQPATSVVYQRTDINGVVQPGVVDAASVIAFGAGNGVEDYYDYDRVCPGWARSLNHFFDPQNNRPLTFTVLGGNLKILGRPSPDWALEDVGDQTTLGVNTEPFCVADGRPQNFSYKDAQRYFLNSFTSSTAAQRKLSFTSALQSLGAVIHHLQDMAQPQHTRNDIHRSLPSSWYELYTQKYVDGRIPAIVQSNPYPIPKFAKARQYWVTPGTSNSLVGMAEFSSKNYVSSGTNFSASGYAQNNLSANGDFPFPGGQNADGTVKSIQNVMVNVKNLDGSTYNGPMYAVVGDVFDGYTGEHKTGRLLTATSLLDKSLLVAGKTRVFALNGAIFENGYPILLPRAVAFSAGLINHFFAGRVNVRRLSSTSGWVIDNIGPDAMQGQFSLLSEDSAGNRSYISGAQWSGVVAAGSSTPVLGDIGSAAKIVGVFSGTIGNETALARVTGKVVPYQVKAVPCGTVLSAAGGSEGFDRVIDLGTVPGAVEVEFEAYQIPDRLDLYAGNGTGSTIVSTAALVSGFRSWTFAHDPQARGTSQVHARVTGNTDTNTQWTLAVSCPGQHLDNGVRARPRINVSVTLDRRNTCGASGYDDIYVNGTSVGRIYYSINGGSVSFVDTVGSLQYIEVKETITNSGGVCSGAGDYNKWSYSDRAGNHSISGRFPIWISIQ